MSPIAHAGHWAIYVLYAIPVLIVTASIVVSVVRQRREGAGPGEAQQGRPPPPRDGE